MTQMMETTLETVRNKIMKRASGAKSQLEKAVKKAQKDVNQYQKQIESKLKTLSRKGKLQVDEAITYVKSQPLANSILEKVEPLKTELHSKEQVIRNLVDTILGRARDVQTDVQNNIRATLKNPMARVQDLKARVMNASSPAKKAKVASKSKSAARKSPAAKKSTQKTAKRSVRKTK